ncbi:MAG: TIGR02996 domain-containing protein [Archangium sp.]|nr:TIGR02996 domain-containing protein [Archangium sp.]
MNAKDLAGRLLESGGTANEDAGELLGVSLSGAAKSRLLAVVKTGRIPLAELLSFIERVSHGTDDVVVERKAVIGRSNTWLQLLGVRWREGDARRLTVGARTHWGSSRLDVAWPELATWSRKPDANRARAEAWARNDEKDRVTFEWRARPPRSGGLDETQLRAAIADAPDEVAPRLVFADWLLEQGNPLGELIHLAHRKAPDLERLRELDESWLRWAGPLAPYTGRQFVKGGFVTEVSMTVPAFEQHGEAFFRMHPIRALSLVWQGLTGEHLGRLSRAPALDLVRVLKLERGHFTQKRLPLAALAEGDHFARLEELHLGRVGDRAADWRSLFSGLRAPKLRRVKLTETRTSASTLQFLALNPELTLTDVSEDQASCFENESGARWRDTLAAFAEHQPSLERLLLEGNSSLSDDAFHTLFVPSSKVSLVKLAARRTGISGKLLEAIARSPRATRLNELAVDVWDALMVEGLEAVLQTPGVPLTTLSVLCNDRHAAVRLNQLLRSLPPKAHLQKVRVRGSMHSLAVDGLGERYTVLP